MTSFLYQIIYMLALLTAKRIEEVIVGTIASSSSSLSLVSATTITTTITTTTTISTISSSNNSDTAIVMNEFNNSNETEWLWQIGYQQQHKKQQQQQQKQHQIETAQQKHILQQIKQGYSDNNYTFHKYQKRHHPNEQFNSFASSSSSFSSSSSSSSLLSLSLLSENENCGGYKTDPYGIIQTPKFPNKFNVPITCVWIIDASELASGPNISIVIYLTQLYVIGGLKFTEYMYYSDDYKVPSHRIFELTEDDVTQVAWIQFTSPYLEIKFTMKTLDGTHLRVLNKFLDVYGFNITYEIDTIKSYQCNALKCRFLGNCYARKDFTSYYCSCFPGYNGIDCGNGPLCADPEVNVCENGGTCKHIGDTAVTCLCPSGFKGNKCEMPEIDELTGCVLQNVSDELHCLQQCKFSFSKYENNNNVNNLSCKNKCNSIFTSNITLQKSKITSPVTSIITTALTSSSSSSESMAANNNSNGTVLNASLPVNSTSSSSFSSSSSSSSSSGSSRADRFHQKDSSYSNRSNKMHYEITIRLGTNLTQLYRQPDSFDRRSNEHLFNLLEKHMGRILRNSNITKVNDLEIISNLSNKLEITFHFMGIKSDSNRIRDTITRLVERGRLGNFTIVSDFLHFDEIPLLQIKSLVINQASPIRENSEFIISCVAKGSSKMEFFWYKDGVTVNESKATRDMWTMRLTSEQKHVYTSILGIHKSNLLDEGIYTCKVIDWDIEQCRSIIIRVDSPPQLRVDPSSITMYRGDSIRIRCLSAGNDQQRYGKLGYSWTKNGELFQSDPNSVMWEDLYPDGSILKIQNIQKSGEFTCIVSNSIAPVSKNVHITVIDRGIIELCPKEILFDIQWPASAPGIPIISDCPKQYKGNSKRMCEQRDIKKSVWLTPDFSECISNEMINIYNEFRALTLGYQRTNCSVILKSCLEYTKKRYTKFFPGEAGFLMDLLQEIENYLKLKGAHLEREMAAEIILHILDKVMQNVYSLNSQQQIKKLQQLTESAALNRETIAASQLAISTSSSSSSSSTSAGSSSSSSSSLTSKKLTAGTSISDASSVTSAKIPLSPSSSLSTAEDVAVLDVPGTESEIHHGDTSSGSMAITDSTPSLDRLNSFRIYTTTVRTLPFNLRLYGKDLFSDQLNMEIAHSKYLQNTLSNGTIFVSVISYKNLTSFLPKTYFTRGGDDLDADYSPASRIIATWLFQSNRSNDNFVLPLNLPLDAGHVEVIFQHENIPPNTDWTPVCGHELRASYEATWRTDLCITKNLMENLTKCICPLSGTFVVLFAKKTFDTSVYRNTARPMFMIISCGCCFLQSCIAFAFLIPILYNRKCCITFLKMQFCTSTSTVMAIFLLGFLKLLPQDWHGIISSTLASLMLLGLSTIVAIALIIQSELVPKKIQMTNLSTINNGIRGSIGISWLLPIIFSICSPLIYTIIGKWPISWWLEYDSSNFILFIIIEILFISLFILLFVILIKKLLYLAKKHDKHNSTICKRIGLLYRIAIVLFLKLATDSLFLVYHNTTNNLIISHIFGVCCVLLGFSILFCFVIKAEHNFRSKPLKKINTKTSVEEYCSGSINSPLSFYANHDIEKDNESGPPISQSPGCIIKSASGHHQQQQQQQRLPLTIISGPQCCSSTVLDRKIPSSSLKCSTESTFCGCLGNETTIIGEKDGRICDISLNEMETTFTCKKLDSSSVLPSHQNHQTSLTGGIPSSIIRACNCGNSTGNCGYKNRCCNLIIGSGSLETTAKHQCQHHHHHHHHHIHNQQQQQQQQHQHQNDNWIEHHQLNDNISGPYDTTNYYQGTNTNINNQINYPTSEKHEFVGVETLDILQGVSPDSILGIRTSNILKTSSGSLKKDIENLNSCSVDTSVSKASVTTQTPKSQKRVTIVEEPKKTILLPLSSSSSSSLPSQSVILTTGETSVGSGGASHLIKHQSKIPISPSPPIIMITSSSEENETNLIGCGTTNFSSSISNTTTTITTISTTTSSSSSGNNIKPNKVGGNNNDNNSSNNNTENSFGTDDNDTTESVKTDPIDGMLDRISHDLDYLLNRTNEVPTRRVTVTATATATASSAEICDNAGISHSDCNNTTIDNGTRGYNNSIRNPSNINDTINCSNILKQSDIAVVLSHQNDVITTSSILPPPPQPASMPPSIITSVPIPPSIAPPPPSLSSSTHCRSVHEVIIEESEQE